jgi:hypothetical protein
MASVLKETLYATGTASRVVDEARPTVADAAQQTAAQTHDGNDTYFDSAQADGEGETALGLFRVSWGLGALSYAGTIDSIKIYIRCRYVAAANTISPAINEYARGTAHGTSSWADYTDVFTTDPADSQPWTAAKLSAQTFGYEMSVSASDGQTTYAQVSEFKVEVWGSDAQITNATAHEVAAAHEAGASAPGPVSTDASEHAATAETGGTSAPGVRVVIGTAHEMAAAHVAGDTGGKLFIVPATYDADTITTKALYLDGDNRAATLRAVGGGDDHLGDADNDTWRQDLTSQLFSGRDFYVACATMGTSSIAGLGIISSVRLHAACCFLKDSATGDYITLTDPKFVLVGRTATMTTPPIETGYEFTDCTATLTTHDGTNAWTWDNIFAALTALRVQVTGTYTGSGVGNEVLTGPAGLVVAELWAEVYGPLGAPRRKLAVDYVIAPIRRTLTSRLTL